MRNFIGFVFFIFLAFTACNNSEPRNLARTSHEIHTNAGALDSLTSADLKAPDFTLTAMNGQEFSLSDYQGKVVVLNHWATWCGFCISETPDFIELQEELRDQGVVFVGISPEEWDKIRPFAKEYGINYILLRDDGSFDEKYPLGPYPTTFIINRRGEIAHIIKTATTKELLKPLLTELAARKVL